MRQAPRRVPAGQPRHGGQQHRHCGHERQIAWIDVEQEQARHARQYHRRRKALNRAAQGFLELVTGGAKVENVPARR